MMTHSGGLRFFFAAFALSARALSTLTPSARTAASNWYASQLPLIPTIWLGCLL